MAILTKGQTFATGDQVTATKLNDLVDAATFASGAVDSSTTQLSGGAIIVKDSGITAAKLASDAVTTAKILDANVTTAKLADSAVTVDKITDATITSAKLATQTAIDINGGAIDGTPIGASSPSTGVFTTITGTAITGSTSIKSTGTGGIGYATGAGGAVTQNTSKSTGVTLNTTCGRITINSASLASDTTVSFILTNSCVESGDVMVFSQLSGTLGAYIIVADCNAGSATIALRNVTAGAIAESFIIAFVVIKCVAS